MLNCCVHLEKKKRCPLSVMWLAQKGKTFRIPSEVLAAMCKYCASCMERHLGRGGGDGRGRPWSWFGQKEVRSGIVNSMQTESKGKGFKQWEACMQRQGCSYKLLAFGRVPGYVSGWCWICSDLWNLDFQLRAARSPEGIWVSAGWCASAWMLQPSCCCAVSHSLISLLMSPNFVNVFPIPSTPFKISPITDPPLLVPVSPVGLWPVLGCLVPWLGNKETDMCLEMNEVIWFRLLQ